MKVRVYFCKEPDPEIILKGNKISSQALNTIYDLVWENEFKNILNAGRIWIKFMEEEQPFGTPLKKKEAIIECLWGTSSKCLMIFTWLIK